MYNCTNKYSLKCRMSSLWASFFFVVCQPNALVCMCQRVCVCLVVNVCLSACMPVTPICQLIGPKAKHWQVQFRHSMNLKLLDFKMKALVTILWHDFLTTHIACGLPVDKSAWSQWIFLHVETWINTTASGTDGETMLHLWLVFTSHVAFPKVFSAVQLKLTETIIQAYSSHLCLSVCLSKSRAPFFMKVALKVDWAELLYIWGLWLQKPLCWKHQ